MRRPRWSTCRRLGVVLALLLGTSPIVAAPAVAAPPSNDDTAGSVLIDDLPFVATVDTTEATWASTDPSDCPNTSSVWFTFTPNLDMTVKVSGVGSSFEPAFTVMSGSPESLSFVTCGYQGARHPVVFSATAGTTYWIMAATCCYFYGSDYGGSLVLTVSEIAPPANDDIANAEVVPGLPFEADVDTTVATMASGDPTGCDTPHRSVWYSFTPTEDMALLVQTSGYQTLVSAWTGSPDALVEVGGCQSFWNQFDLQAGVQYWILVSSQYGPGGQLHASFRIPNQVQEVSIDRHGVLSGDVLVNVSGTVSCTSSGWISLQVYAEQTFKRPPITILGYGAELTFCDGVTSWSMGVSPYPNRFVSGRATATVIAQSVDGFFTEASSTERVTFIQQP